MKRLKIAFLTEFFYPHIGGCEKRLFEIGRRLASKGHEIHVFTIQYDRNLPQEEKIDGVNVHRYAFSRSYISEDSFRSLGGILQYSSASFFKLLGSKFDLYYANQWPMLHSLCTKPIASPFIQEWCEVWDKPLRASIMQRLIKRVGDFNVAVSEFTRQRLVDQLKINFDKISLIPNGVDLERFYNSRKKIKGRIIYAGRIVPHKHVELLVKAFQKVKAKIPDAELHIIGSGLSLKSIKQMSKNTKDCYVHGFLPDEKMVDLFKSSWLFVLPSEREGSGIAALEAMAAGVPFITADFPNNAAKELCRFECGLVIEPEEDAFASAIIELYKNDELWNKLSANALSTAKMHDWDNIATQMEDLFNTVVKNATD